MFIRNNPVNQLKSVPIHSLLRLAMRVYTMLMRIATKFAIPPRRPTADLGYDVLLTGTFYSDNWIKKTINFHDKAIIIINPTLFIKK